MFLSNQVFQLLDHCGACGRVAGSLGSCGGTSSTHSCDIRVYSPRSFKYLAAEQLETNFIVRVRCPCCVVERVVVLHAAPRGPMTRVPLDVVAVARQA